MLEIERGEEGNPEAEKTRCAGELQSSWSRRPVATTRQ